MSLVCIQNHNGEPALNQAACTLSFKSYAQLHRMVVDLENSLRAYI
jgi:predicted transcriptional regulator